MLVNAGAKGMRTGRLLIIAFQTGVSTTQTLLRMYVEWIQTPTESFLGESSTLTIKATK
ncbi:hypothetical protein FRC08_015022 [Ceratobasidium sp. 394]|nr:hypothetical protein FRC08_015022 [Ceratobasidium sp. 394]